MQIIPRKVEYRFEAGKHTLGASAEHLGRNREIKFYFDDLLVGTTQAPEGKISVDDECILEAIEDYYRNNSGIYADVFGRHSDQITLNEKHMYVDITEAGFNQKVHIVSTGEKYKFEISSEDGRDKLVGNFQSEDCSEILEKMRVFISMVTGVCDEMTMNLTELSNDKIKQWIRW